jgi:hypothetical protein
VKQMQTELSWTIINNSDVHHIEILLLFILFYVILNILVFIFSSNSVKKAKEENEVQCILFIRIN